ncbi:MAG: hypothetical protein GY795_48020 [Desulfobacterales bacterium]|nr:hypothetical protein [Desulfobacterales bacterium]
MKQFKTMALCFGFIFSMFWATAWAQDENLKYMVEESDFVSTWRIEEMRNLGSVSKESGYTEITVLSYPFGDSATVAHTMPFSVASGTILDLRIQVRCETSSMALASLSIISSSGEEVEETVGDFWFQNDSEWRSLTIEDFQITSATSFFYIAIVLSNDSSANSSIFHVRNLSSNAVLMKRDMSGTCETCRNSIDCRNGNCATFTNGNLLCIPWDASIGYTCEIKTEDDSGGGCFIDTCGKQNKAASVIMNGMFIQDKFHEPIMFNYP